MLTYKIPPRILTSGDLEKLMRHVNAVDGRRAFPSYVYVSPNTAKRLRRSLSRAIKKEHPWTTNSRRTSAAGMEWLNLGPVECDGIKDGYAVVDNLGLLRELNTAAPQDDHSTTSKSFLSET